MLIREYGVKVDPPLLPQLDPDLVRKAGVENLIAVEVADLPAADLKANSPRSPGPASMRCQEVTSLVIARLLLAWS